MRFVLSLAALAILSAVLLWQMPKAAAQSNVPSPDQTEEDANAAPPSLAARAVLWVFDAQRRFQRELTRNLRELADRPTAAAAFTLMFAGFVYGALHAAGPGHGKAVLTTYLLTHRQQMRRGLWIAAAASLCQGLVAVILVYGLIGLIGGTPHDNQTAVRWTEQMSFGLIALVGAILGWQGMRAFFSRPANGHHDHVHSEAECGHRHLPEAKELLTGQGARTTITIIVSMGLRPCSGAILILAVAEIVSLQWVGIAAVGMMSLGTAMSIALLAALVVFFRDRVQRLVRRPTGNWNWAGHLLKLGGGLAIFWIGATLLATSFGPSQPFRF